MAMERGQGGGRGHKDMGHILPQQQCEDKGNSMTGDLHSHWRWAHTVPS